MIKIKWASGCRLPGAEPIAVMPINPSSSAFMVTRGGSRNLPAKDADIVDSDDRSPGWRRTSSRRPLHSSRFPRIVRPIPNRRKAHVGSTEAARVPLIARLARMLPIQVFSTNRPGLASSGRMSANRTGPHCGSTVRLAGQPLGKSGHATTGNNIFDSAPKIGLCKSERLHE